MSKNGHLFVISAPSGAGKTTLVKRLLDQSPLLTHSISATTRRPRPNEKNGSDYHFVTRDEFQKMIEEDQFIEWANVHNQFYGTPKNSLYQQLEDGQSVLLDIDIQGGREIKRNFPDATLIFILPPSLESLRDRLIKRGVNSEEDLAIRLKNAEDEIKVKDHYDFSVVNDELEKAVIEVKRIIKSEHEE